MRPLTERVFDDLKTLVRPGDRVCAAVSGGADSVALLRLLRQLRSRLGVVLSVAHLNHRLRGADSDADADFVAQLAAEHNVPLYAESADAAAYAAEHRLSLEAAGRRLRYAFFARLIRDGHVSRVATGHTADDQAETVLLRLLRGAGTRGLAGIHPAHVGPDVSSGQGARSAPVSPGKAARALSSAEGRSTAENPAIIRPLLSIRRAELRDYLNDLAQPWREDATNADPQFLRNRVRAQLLPRLEQDYNPAIVRVLGETAQIAHAEEEFWTAEIARILPQIVLPDPDDSSALASRYSLLATQSQPLALQRRLLRAIAEQRGLRLDFEHIEQLRNLIASPSGEVQLPGGWRARVAGGELRLDHAHQLPALSPDYAYRLPVPGEIQVRELASRIQAITLPIEEAARGYNRDLWLDPASVAAELEVRNWRHGDRFWPLHTKAPKKVKELLQARRVSAAERARWPVAVSAGEIVWMRGFPAASQHQPGKAGQVLIIQDLPL